VPVVVAPVVVTLDLLLLIDIQKMVDPVVELMVLDLELVQHQ
tara:strand:+ start:190 stop:315 length:126 start_codon:yes stop_codon:yes gene_type:complete